MSERTDKILGERLKKLRLEANLPQAKMASSLGTTQNAVFKYENGECFPPMRILLIYADYFDVSLDWLFGRCSNREGKLYTGVARNEQQRLQDYTDKLFESDSPLGKKLLEVIHKAIEEEKSKK